MKFANVKSKYLKPSGGCALLLGPKGEKEEFQKKLKNLIIHTLVIVPMHPAP